MFPSFYDPIMRVSGFSDEDVSSCMAMYHTAHKRHVLPTFAARELDALAEVLLRQAPMVRAGEKPKLTSLREALEQFLETGQFMIRHTRITAPKHALTVLQQHSLTAARSVLVECAAAAAVLTQEVNLSWDIMVELERLAARTSPDDDQLLNLHLAACAGVGYTDNITRMLTERDFLSEDNIAALTMCPDLFTFQSSLD